MKDSWFRSAVVVFVLTSTGLAVGCFEKNVDGKYRDPEGLVKVELKDGKATLDVGQVHIDGSIPSTVTRSLSSLSTAPTPTRWF